MPITNARITEITKEVVKSSFFSYFLGRKNVTTQHILLGDFFPVESAIRSAIGGLETSLGTNLWEKIATKIASENGFQVLDPKVDFQQPVELPAIIRNLRGQYKELREVEGSNLPISDYVTALNDAIAGLTAGEIPTNYKKLTKGSGVDIYLRKGNIEYAFDIKTVQINAGSGVKFNETLMSWLTYRAIQQKFTNSTYAFNAHFVIPYDPHLESDWWTQFGLRAYPLDHDDILLGDEFWNLISGCQNSLESIKSAFTSLSDENFQGIYSNALHNSGVKVSVDILQAVSKVTCLTPPNDFPDSCGKKLLWKCNGNGCTYKFKVSPLWFKTIRKCKKCHQEFFS